MTIISLLARMFDPRLLIILLSAVTVFNVSAQNESIDTTQVDLDTIHKPLQLGDLSLTLVQHAILPRASILFINVHEDEQTSIEALRSYSKDTSISYAYLHHSGERRITFKHKGGEFSVDPNRIFTKTGRKATLEDGEHYTMCARKETKQFAAHIESLVSNRMSIIALHNNTDTNYSILSYLPDSSESQNATSLYINPEMDPDDFIYTTDELVYKAMVEHKINVILQDNKNFVDDGSLSVYCAINKIRYVNIETEHGHLEEQIVLIELIHRIMGSKTDE